MMFCNSEILLIFRYKVVAIDLQYSCIMATSTQAPNSPSPVAVKTPLTFILLFMLLGVIIASLGFSGIWYYFAHSGRISLRRNTPKIASPLAPSTHLMVLDPLLVNLEDEGRNSYLRLGITLQLVDVAEKKDPENKDGKSGDEIAVAVRDTTLTVLGRQTASSLLAPHGKERLKVEIRKALAEHNTDLKVTGLFFTDFLVQQ
jgi:flagellar FliL protein